MNATELLANTLSAGMSIFFIRLGPEPQMARPPHPTVLTTLPPPLSRRTHA